MQTEAFDPALNALIHLSSEKRLVPMCAEAVPWRCHRSLIADALVAQGISVEEVLSKSSSRPHTLTPFAIRIDNKIIYPRQVK